MATRTLIIADDLTGALDVAGPFAQRGLDTQVVVDASSDWRHRVTDAQVISINADSRHLSAAQAAEKVRAIVAPLLPFDGVLLKKIDSTLRGQVVAETLALMHASGRRLVIVSPAFPAQGRTVRQGVVWVKGVPLPETAFARDALSPPPSVPLAQAFRQADSAIAVRNVASANLSLDMDSTPTSLQIWIADAETQADLDQSVRALGPRAAQGLWVGTAGIAQALATHNQAQQAQARMEPQVRGRILVVVGSRAEQSQRQVERLQSRADTHLVEAPNGQVSGDSELDTGSASVVILRAVRGAQGEGQADEVAAALARTACDLMRTQGVDAVVAAGGDTARAILAASACSVLHVLGDLVPGIPYSQLTVATRPVWLITKAGGFGTDATLAELVDRLRGMP
ncbi:MAG: four-carbon acid sugar kinase family protein [Betaproteobacteria bacterium]|nr:four-carbon acid sugar kinase family protein [Betaproteobacteria bacterium]